MLNGYIVLLSPSYSPFYLRFWLYLTICIYLSIRAQYLSLQSIFEPCTMPAGALMPITDTTMSDEWNTAPVAPKPIFDESEACAMFMGQSVLDPAEAHRLAVENHKAGGQIFDNSGFFPAPEPPPPIPVPPQPVSAALVPAEPVPVVTTDPWHAPWCGPCSPEMAQEIKALLAAGVEFEQPEDAEGAKYPLMRLEPLQSLVWQCASMAAARILHNRVNVYINRVTKRSGRHFKTMKHIHGPDMISLEVSRII